jgi:hypothetical protein
MRRMKPFLASGGGGGGGGGGPAALGLPWAAIEILEVESVFLLGGFAGNR